MHFVKRKRGESVKCITWVETLIETICEHTIECKSVMVRSFPVSVRLLSTAIPRHMWALWRYYYEYIQGKHEPCTPIRKYSTIYSAGAYQAVMWSRPKLRDRDLVKFSRLENMWIMPKFSKNFQENVITTSKLKFFWISGIFLTCKYSRQKKV